MTAASDRPAEHDRSSDEPRPAQRRAGRRRISAAEAAKLARIFGDPLPSTTRDERSPEPDQGGSSDDWLRSQVPPHHG